MVEHAQSAEAVADVSEPRDSGETGSPWSAMDALDERERRFVITAMQGKDWNECAVSADVKSEIGIVRMLGRPRVRAALQAVAPLAAAIDPKRGARMVRPYLMEKVIGTALTASDAQSTQAIKEILAVDGITRREDSRLAAGLMDVLSAVERRLSARTITAEVVKVPELPAPETDTESLPIGIATIPDASSAGDAGSSGRDAARPGRRRGRGPRKPPA